MTRQRYINNNKSKQNVCLATIKDAKDTRQMRVLAAYYFLKQHFSHTIIYDYRGRKHFIADILGVSERTVTKYIGVWRHWGLVHDHRFNLVLTSTNKIKWAHRERRKYVITVTDNETINTIENRLHAKLLEQHGQSMGFYRRLTRYARRNKQARRSDGHIKWHGESLPEQPAYSFSLRNVAKELNVSHTKAKNILDALNSLGVIATQKTAPRYVTKAPKGSLHTTEGLPGYYFYLNGSVYQVFGNRHVFLEHPPNNKNLTYKQFIQHYKNNKESVQRVIGDIFAENGAIKPC